MRSGAQRKLIGQAKREKADAAFVQRARLIARRYSEVYGRVTADDVRRVCADKGIKPKHQNSWGCLWKDGFESIGFETSSRPQAQGRVIRVWKHIP